MKLIVLPDDGVTPLMKAIHRAKRRIDMVIFRFDRVDLEKALPPRSPAVSSSASSSPTPTAAARSASASSSRGCWKPASRCPATADDLPRYHGKMVLIDDELFVLGFNFTRLDIEQSRSFGVISREPKPRKEAEALFEADSTRQPYSPHHDQLVVSPDTSRQRLTALISKAKKQLLIYDSRISDKLILRLLREKADAGVEIRVIGKLAKPMAGIATRACTDLRLHVRSIVADGSTVFIGSQSLRKMELDQRREIGVMVKDARIARKVQAVFEADWNLGTPDKACVDGPAAGAGATAAPSAPLVSG